MKPKTPKKRPSPLVAPQTARATIRAGKSFVMETGVRATPLGLLAIGGLVAAILLSVPPIIRAGTRRFRMLPAPDPQLPPPIELIPQREGAGG